MRELFCILLMVVTIGGSFLQELIDLVVVQLILLINVKVG